MRSLFILLLIFFARNVSANVVFNEIQISPISERFIELYNSGDSDVDLTGWYIQRKTATGSSFSSLVTSTQFKDRIIKADGYFVISRGQLEKSDIIIDNLTLTEANTVRIRDSKGEDSDQVEWTAIDDGKSYQKISASEWVINTPTPIASNNNISSQGVPSSQSSFPASTQTPSSLLALSNFPIEPQIIANAGGVNRVALAGAPIVFSGKVLGFKREPIENARMAWSFGDGAREEGQSVSHIYYYPGEYIVVLEVSSGYYSASARVRVVVSTPKLILRTGGDSAHSFFSIENQGDNEIDISGWRISATDKNFLFPQNTILGARKTVPFPSEVTGLIAPLGISPSLYFPNGTLVMLYQEKISPAPATGIPFEESSGKIISRQSTPTPAPQLRGSQKGEQAASVLNTLSDPFIHSNTLAPAEEERRWFWYLGVGSFGAVAFIGFRFSRGRGKTDSVDDYEIIEDNTNKEGEDQETAQPQRELPF